jgi:hypothetical protein
MDNNTGLIIGKIGFYLAVIALIVVFVIKKRKQLGTNRKNQDDNKPNNL